LKALVVCTGGGIGDVLLATPVMRALRARYAAVVALTAPAHREVLAGNLDLAEVLLDDGPFGTVRARLARERFDAAIVTWATPRSAALPFAAGIPVRVGQSRRLYSRLFNRRVTVRSELGDRTTHWTQILLDYARAVGCDVDDATPAFAYDEHAAVEAKTLLAEAGIHGEYAVLHPTRGIASARARWPSERLGSVGRALRDAFDVPIVVSGDTGDREIAETVAGAARGTSIAGRTSISQFGALAAGARFVVAMDSGPMHLAGAVGAPTVGVFALQSDEPDRWRPLGKRTAIVRPSYPCPPFHRKETCPDFACIRELPVEAVIDAVAGLLSGAPQPASREV
jgi:ADP-heptose:LPS heptosyltransferase